VVIVEKAPARTREQLVDADSGFSFLWHAR
jgi:hypothetical protein